MRRIFNFQFSIFNKGFTLIELLVVLAIISLLISLLLVRLSMVRREARDTRRVSDLYQVGLALATYNEKFGQYPGTSGSNDWATMKTELESQGFISVVPDDPGTNLYEYWVSSDNQEYVLNATLEDPNHPALDRDVDGSDVLGCNCDGLEYCLKP